MKLFVFFYNFEIQNVCSDVPRRCLPGRRAPDIAPRDGISCSGEPLTPICAAHWAVTQVHGTNFVQLKGVRGNIYGIVPIILFLHFCAKPTFLVRFLRIHPVQSVVNAPTQLSGRGFTCIFYKMFFVAPLRFLVLQNGRRTV